MRISIPQPQLLKHLQIVEHAINDRSTLPILANVLLQTTAEGLVLTATDLDVGVQCRFPLSPPPEIGAVALPARKLSTIVRELPDEMVILEAKKNHTAIVNCGTSTFRIPGLPAEDFPVLPPVQPEQGFILAQGAFKALITQTAHAMSMEETRFILNGALLTIGPQSAESNHHLMMVATDGRRLAVASAALIASSNTPFSVIIPAKTVRELGRLLQNDGEQVALLPMKDNQLAVRFRDVTMVTRLIEGQFPPYEKVIPAPSKQLLVCQRQGLMDAVRRAGLMTTAASQAVVFEVTSDRLVVSKESAELGSAREELPITYSGSPLTAAFNPEFWLDVLKVMETDEVRIELQGPDKPAVVRQPGLTYVVLPMRTA